MNGVLNNYNMIQTITIPERQEENTISEIYLLIADPQNVRARVLVQKRTVGDTRVYPPLPYTVLVNELLASEIALGNLTNADVQGLKKCIKAIIAKGLNIDYTTTNDPL